MEKGLGRVYIPDERDWILAAAEEPARKPRRPFYNTGLTLDQGNYPHCVGYAWRQWLSSAHLMTKGGMDAVAIYNRAQRLDYWPGEAYAGTSVRGGAKALQEAGHIESYFFAPDLETVIGWIVDGYGTVVLGIDWYEGMGNPDKRDFIHPTGNKRGGHAILAVGYSKRLQAVRLLNSWGPLWGKNGRAWLDQTDLKQLLAQYGEACMAVERRA